MSTNEPQSLSAVYATAEAHRNSLETHLSSSTPAFQETLISAIKAYRTCLRLTAAISLFSPNESLEDVASKDLKYLLLHWRVAELILRKSGAAIEERRSILLECREYEEAFLLLLDGYDALTRGEASIMERYLEDRDSFELSAATDAAKRRNEKIERYRAEKALKAKLEALQKSPRAMQEDDSILRELRITEIRMAVQNAFSTLEATALELKMIKMAPPVGQQTNGHVPLDDPRLRTRQGDGYSERLDGSLAGLMQNSTKHTGPLLSSTGRPLRPFTLMDARSRVQDGVFRPDHSLPTMSIDEYLEEERRRGGIIEGGGEASGQRPQVDEDDMDAADRDTMEKRRWDEYTEQNPRGSGNTMNMG